MGAFLARAGWGEAERRPLAGDASSRAYSRLAMGGRTAVLMDAPPAAEAPSCPPQASVGERQTLGYNALARLAGPNPAAFAGLARELRARGFSAPEIYDADLDAGFLLLEDLGDNLYARAIDAGADPEPLYAAAIDLLAAVRRASVPQTVSADARAWPILGYDAAALQAEADLFLDWYAARRARAPVDEAARAEWTAIWTKLFKTLETEPPALVLRDVHAENLIWLPERDGPARAGLLDFQDALFGHPAYDLASLLKDARRDVATELADAMVARFMDAAYVDDREAFATAYAVLGAQRNAKILGVFVRLAERDGKPVYLKHLPRVARHFLADLAHPALAELANWLSRYRNVLVEEARG